MINITFPANEELTDIIQDWGRELEHRLKNISINYDRDKDFMAVKEGHYIIVMANPILNKDMEIEGEEFVPSYNIEAHIYYPPPSKQPDWWMDGGIYNPPEPTVKFVVPRIIIRIPYLVVVLNEDGSLYRDGGEWDGLGDFMQEKVNREQERFMENIGRMVMSNFDKGMSA